MPVGKGVEIDAEEIDRVARALARDNAAARHALRHYLRSNGGRAMAEMVLPTLKRQVAAVVFKKDLHMRRDTHMLLLTFAAKYGLRVRRDTDPDSGYRTARVSFRVTPTEMDRLQQAAKKDGHATYAEWCRHVIAQAADELLGDDVT